MAASSGIHLMLHLVLAAPPAGQRRPLTAAISAPAAPAALSVLLGVIIGGRIYFDLTTPADIPHHRWGVFAV